MGISAIDCFATFEALPKKYPVVLSIKKNKFNSSTEEMAKEAKTLDLYKIIQTSVMEKLANIKENGT